MKLYITNFGINSKINNYVEYITNEIPKYSNHKIVKTIEEADIIFVEYLYNSWDKDFVFCPCETYNKPIVIFDLFEFETVSNKSHFLAFNTDPVHYTNISEYTKLDNWLKTKISQIKMYFKREFLINDNKPPIPTYPTEYCVCEEYYFRPICYEPSTYEEFCNRMFNVSFIFSPSNKSRLLICGEMIKTLLLQNGFNPYKLCIDENITKCKEFKETEGKGILLLFKPNFFKLDCFTTHSFYKQSKISLSIWGVGRKCIRDSELSFSSVMALQQSNQYYSYPWIDNENCIILPNKEICNYEIDEKESIEKIVYYLQQPKKLYDIYLNGIENSKKYRVDNYLINYIIPKLEEIDL